GILSQEYLWNKSLSITLEEKKDSSDSKCITSFFCDDSSSCVIRSEFEHSVDQLWYRSATFPKRDIAHYWKKGYAITAMNWSNGSWLILFSKGIAYARKESWETIFNPKPYKLSKTFRKEGKIITSLCFGDGKWAISYAQHPKIFSQKIYLGKDFPENEITELWNENFDISKVAYGNGLWFFTFINSSETDFNVQDKFKELYRAKKFNDATLFFKEHLYHSFGSPEPIILDYLQCFKRLKKYEDGMNAFEHFNTLFGTYHEALNMGGDFYYLAFKQSKSEAFLSKALKYYSLILPATPAIQRKMDELRPLLEDDHGSDNTWKQQMARKEQEKRKTDRELKNKKF
ncbi:MAG: hypothetical protein QNK40_07060, partial [Desulfobacterales bacterium]|nr:hypothetical protein [Desulfobacterales bacterium]MDX2508971.1 hypothetical protein [Desulfobacterales bacterium]